MFINIKLTRSKIGELQIDKSACVCYNYRTPVTEAGDEFMLMKKSTKTRRFKGVFAGFLIFLAMLPMVGQVVTNAVDAYADDPVPTTSEETSTTNENTSNTSNTDGGNASADNGSNDSASSTDNSGEADTDLDSDARVDRCKKSMGSLGWIVCPFMEKISEAVDWLYEKIEGILTIKPIEAKDGTPIYEIWKWCLTVANVVFIIFLLIVIYSQLTGWGINNYGIKKVLPKLIVMVVLVNLSFLICSLLVDVSNIIGGSLRGVFQSAENAVLANAGTDVAATSVTVSMADVYTSLVGGTVLAIGVVAVAFETGAIWMLIPVVLGAIVAVATGLITIALRQAVVMLLVMVAPLAFVANIMPNTEQYFQKWKKLLERMLVFYPLFSLLFGASQLAGFAIIMSAKDGFMLLLGMAVQIFPLFFSWKLMQMSGTFLGGINTRLRALTAKPVAGSRAWAAQKRQQTSLNRMVYGRTPMSHLMRFMDNKKALEAKHMENLQTIRKSEAGIYTQRKIAAGYDGTKAQGTDGDLKANKYTRAAKDASTVSLESEMVSLDTEHVISNYGDYFVKRDIRERAKAAEKAGNKELAERIKLSNAESRRNMAAGRTYLQYSRAKMTRENDEESDFNFMVGEFLDSYNGYDPNKKDDGEFSKYKNLIASSAGGLGEVGETRVLGKIIAKAAAVESNQRRDINIIANKHPHAKSDFRNMLVGYYVDDNGYATDKNGNRLPGEKYRGYLLAHDPSQLVLWDKIDNDGRKYFDWYDGDKFVTRIFEDDRAAVKELLTNFDAPINDPINNLYGILSGIKPGENGIPEHVGLKPFRTTMGRALAGFKEKNAAMSPMVAEMIKKGYVKNYAQEYLAYLDSLNKATKPGTFNMQDSDAIEMFITIMDPRNWGEIFPKDLIEGFQNVNGEPISGYELDDNGEIIRNDKGKPVKVKDREPTYDELMACVKDKFIFPAAHKITMMMSKQTPNTADNQKAGTVPFWKELKEVFDTQWGKDSPLGEDPYEQKGDMLKIARGVRSSLYTDDSVTAYIGELESMYIGSQNDGESFAQDLLNFCMANKDRVGFAGIMQAFAEYCDGERAAGRYLDCDKLREEFENLIIQFCAD